MSYTNDAMTSMTARMSLLTDSIQALKANLEKSNLASLAEQKKQTALLEKIYEELKRK